MRSVLFCFPPKQRGSEQFYFRTQQLIDSLKKEFPIEIIAPLAKTGGSRDKKFSFKKVFVFLFNLPSYLKKIKKTEVIIIFPSPIWYFWIIVGKLFNKKIAIDHYVTAIFPLENSKIPNFLKIIIFYLDKFFYQKIDLVITHTKTMKEEIRKAYGIKKEKIIVIYSLVDINLFDPEKLSLRERNQLKEYYHLPKNKKIILYHGEYHSFHGLSVIEKIAFLSKQKNKDYIFVFVGGKGKKRENMYFLEYMKFEKLYKILSLADLWLGRFDNSQIAQRTASSCMMQAMAMKVPVITFATPENRSIIKDSKNSFLTTSLDPKKIFLKIERLLKDEQLLEKVGNNARKTIKDHFSLKEWHKVNLILKKYESSI